MQGVARLMRTEDLRGVSRRKSPRTTNRKPEEARPTPDLIQRDFTASRPNELWARIQLHLRAVQVSRSFERGLGFCTSPSWWMPGAAGKRASAPPWARSGIAEFTLSEVEGIMPSARVSSRPWNWNVNCSTVIAFRPRQKHAWLYSSSLKAGTIRTDDTQPSAIFPPTGTKPFRLVLTSPKPPSVHKNGSCALFVLNHNSEPSTHRSEFCDNAWCT